MAHRQVCVLPTSFISKNFLYYETSVLSVFFFHEKWKFFHSFGIQILSILLGRSSEATKNFKVRKVYKIERGNKLFIFNGFNASPTFHSRLTFLRKFCHVIWFFISRRVMLLSLCNFLTFFLLLLFLFSSYMSEFMWCFSFFLWMKTCLVYQIYDFQLHAKLEIFTIDIQIKIVRTKALHVNLCVPVNQFCSPS